MSLTQNEKISQLTESTMVVGIDIASDRHWARSFDWRGIELEKAILREGADTVGAVILEPITAGGGVITPPEGYWPKVMEICKQYNVLLHIDEVVCGLGRTGEWFGYQHYGIKPDIVTLAKGVASSYAAISCTVTTEEVFNEFLGEGTDKDVYFRDISTYAGCTGGPAAPWQRARKGCWNWQDYCHRQFRHPNSPAIRQR